MGVITWSAEEDAELIRMKRARFNRREMALHLGRTVMAIKGRMNTIRSRQVSRELQARYSARNKKTRYELNKIACDKLLKLLKKHHSKPAPHVVPQSPPRIMTHGTHPLYAVDVCTSRDWA